MKHPARRTISSSTRKIRKGSLPCPSGFGIKADGTTGEVSADLYDAAASLSGPVGARVSYAAGARVGYVGPLLSA